MPERELEWEMRRIAACASVTLGYAINFQFGSPTELKNGLALLGKSDRRAEKWPFMGLYLPYGTRTGGEYDEVSLTILLANYTTPDRLSRERLTENFEPLLLPMYREILRQIQRSQFFVVMDRKIDMPHQMFKHDYFGKEATGDRKKAFVDFVDVVEIRDLKLKLAYKNCV